MYSYTWDTETGGLLLNSSPLAFSKEPRPVYYKELDILGFDKIWKYAKDDSYPYMWAEANNYFYRGRLVAKTKGGSLYTAPEIVPLEEPEENGQPLRFVDIPAMVEKNRDLIEKLAQDAIKRIYNTYVEYKNKVDLFYVAFSGGKDSIVVLDLVQRTLPHNNFKVLFGDTGMEFPDTYNVVQDVECYCNNSDIDFIRARSVYKPEYTWSKFGPPATVTRWCCTVHKTAPQIIALRANTGKFNFTGMAFIGIRASESLSRSAYDYINLGGKHKGQYSCNPILEWNSAELYSYIFTEKLIINEAYKKGHRRAGCLVCPRATERNDWMSQVCYPNEVDSLVSVVKNMYKKSFQTDTQMNDFISNGGWKARKNGRDISINLNYLETYSQSKPIIKINNPNTEWKEWIKTIGSLQNDYSPYHILFNNEQLTFEVKENNSALEVLYAPELPKSHPLFVKLLKQVFRKAACCILCKGCEADCHNGCINMDNERVLINDRCIHCFQCHNVEKGCLIYKSLEMPKGGLKMTATKSLNCYSHHAPRIEWFEQFLFYKDDFDRRHTLGSQMYSFFKRFLRDANLLNESGFTYTAKVVDKLGLNNISIWGIMLINLAYTPQINWLIKHITMNESYSREYVISLLVSDGAKESWVGDIWSSFMRITELPFGTIGLGYATKEKNRTIAITRTPWETPAPVVILYSLYKFAEACGGYYQFTLNRLLAHDTESDGVSPTEIFGLERDQMERLLNGLSVNYPDFITTSFTLDLDNITLNADKTSQDVLSLL